jgi:hypothetical protein
MLVDGSTDTQRIVLRDARSGLPLTTVDPSSGRRFEVGFPTHAGAEPVLMRCLDDRLYVWSSRSLASFSTSDPTSREWVRYNDPTTAARRLLSHSMLFTRSHVVALASGEQASSVQIEPHSRLKLENGTESGILHDMLAFELPIDRERMWQAVAGGLCVVTADDRLVFLPGSARAAAR